MTLALFDMAEFVETRPVDVLDCMHSIWDLEHYDTCLGFVCPRCHLSEPTAYFLLHYHGPHSNGHVDLCNTLMWAIDQSGCCLGCRGYTFGHTACIFEGCSRYEAGHVHDFHSDDDCCKACGIPPRMIWKWGVW